MKNWETPKMKVYSVKMDENIAASGDGGYQVAYIYYDEGGITRGGANYNWSGNNMIQDTSVSFTDDGEKTVPYSQVGAISGCLA